MWDVREKTDRQKKICESEGRETMFERGRTN